MKDNAVASVGLGKQRHANPITKTSLPNRTTYHIGNSNIASHRAIPKKRRMLAAADKKLGASENNSNIMIAMAWHQESIPFSDADYSTCVAYRLLFISVSFLSSKASLN